MYRNIFFILITLLAFGLSSPTRADDIKSSEETVITYDDYGSIPEALAAGIHANTFLEKYIASTLQAIRNFSEDKISLTQEDIDKKIEAAIYQKEKRQLQQFVNYDLDRNAILTKEEIRESLLKQSSMYSNSSYQSRLESMVDNMMKYDQDHDDILTYQEAGTLDEKEVEKIKNSSSFTRVQQYLKLDPNDDGSLTIDELKKLARKAFFTVDTDHDSRISQDEHSTFINVWKTYKLQTRAVENISEKCTFDGIEFPDNMKVYSTGAYTGRKVGYQIDESGHQGTQIDIVVNEPSSPVALILGAYEPTIWNISHTPETKILAVLAGGYHKQFVSGLDDSVPILVSTHKEKGPCGYFYLSKNKLNKLNPISRSVFKKPADMFYPVDPNGHVIIGNKDYDKNSLVQSEEKTVKAFKLKDTPLSGTAGLQEALKKGILRKATQADAQAWIDKLVEKEKSNPAKDLPPIAGDDSLRENLPKMRLFNAYVVLDDFVYPAGLYGGNSATFIIPEGVNLPTGNPGHSAIYDFNSLKCLGAVCRSE